MSPSLLLLHPRHHNCLRWSIYFVLAHCYGFTCLSASSLTTTLKERRTHLAQGHPVRKWLSWHLNYTRLVTPRIRPQSRASHTCDTDSNNQYIQAWDSRLVPTNTLSLQFLFWKQPSKKRPESSSADFREEKCDI